MFVLSVKRSLFHINFSQTTAAATLHLLIHITAFLIILLSFLACNVKIFFWYKKQTRPFYLLPIGINVARKETLSLTCKNVANFYLLCLPCSLCNSNVCSKLAISIYVYFSFFLDISVGLPCSCFSSPYNLFLFYKKKKFSKLN